MAHARIAIFPGGTEEQYRAVVEELGRSHTEPHGRLMISAGPTNEGWTIIQIWESRDDLDAFVNDALRPAFERAGQRGFRTPPQVTDFEVRDLIR